MADKLDHPTGGDRLKQDTVKITGDFIFTHGSEESLKRTVELLCQDRDPRTVLRVIQDRERFWRSNLHVDGDRLDRLKATIDTRHD